VRRCFRVHRRGKIHRRIKARARAGAPLGGVVGTVMSNLAMETALKREGIEFARAKVGDRYVLEQLYQRGWQVGGEASGHILCLDKHNTGDGTIAALQVLAALQELGQPLSRAVDWQPYPQTMLNVALAEGQDWQQASAAALAEVEQQLGDRGRVA